eukprot:751826-Hanusia_phi.AAC.1
MGEEEEEGKVVVVVVVGSWVRGGGEYGEECLSDRGAGGEFLLSFMRIKFEKMRRREQGGCYCVFLAALFGCGQE